MGCICCCLSAKWQLIGGENCVAGLPWYIEGTVCGKHFTYLSLIFQNVPSHDVEHSEVLLYYIRILEDLHEFSFALEQLDFYAKERAIVDKTAIAEHRGLHEIYFFLHTTKNARIARLLSKSGRIDEASQAWRSLVDQNSEFCEYYRQLFALKSIDLDNVSDDNRSEAMRYLDELMFELPRSTTPRRLALGLSTGIL